MTRSFSTAGRRRARRFRFAIVAAACAGAGVAACGQSPATAQAPATTSSPSPQPSPVTPALTSGDPCGGRARLLATLNRPTVGFSACAVPAGAIVLEEGYQNSVQGAAPVQVGASYPQGFERFGIADRVEFDIVGPTSNRVRTGTVFASGASDIGAGFKYELPQSGRLIYAVDGLFTTASGANGFTAGAPTETANVDVAYALSPAVGVGTTLALQAVAGFDGGGNRVRFGAFMPSFVVTAQIPNAYQFYVEFVGQSKVAPGLGGRVYADFGVQKLLGPNVEIDVEYAGGFTPNAAALHYIGLGTGIRLR